MEHRPNILIVDDDLLVGNALGRLIGERGRVSVVKEAHQALSQLAAGERFAVILCEARLPNITASAFRDAVMWADADQARRIVFMSWDTLSVPTRDRRGIGDDEILEKPISAEALHRILRRHLG